MNKPIAIIAGEPNSISSEIIFKSWKYRKKSLFRPFFIIGSYDLLNKQKKKLKFSIKLKKIDNIKKMNFSNKDSLPVFDIKYSQKNCYSFVYSSKKGKNENHKHNCFKTCCFL